MILKKYICIIPARGNSKEIKNKNLKKINNKSLIEITYTEAKRSKIFDKIFISTESNRIRSKFPKIIPFLRPKKLSEDHVHVSEVVIHALNEFRKLGLTFKNVVMLLPTSPLRKSKHIIESIKLFEKNKSKSLISITDTGKLLTNLRFLENNNRLLYFDKKIKKNISRQSSKSIFAVNGSIFISNVKSFMKYKTFHTDNAIGYKMSIFESVDINTKEDLKLAKLMYDN